MATTVPKSSSRTSRVRLIQNLETSQLLWLDQDVNEKQDNLMMQRKLQRAINTPKTFANVRECEEYLRNSNNKDQKVVLILSDGFGRELIPHIHAVRQLSAFYVYCFDEKSNKHWTEKYSKLSVFDKPEKLIDQLKEDQRLRERMDHTSVGMSVYHRKGLKQRNAMFLHLQLFIEIILKMKSSNDGGKKELIQSLKEMYDGNDAQLSVVAEFERDYAPQNAIWCYTRNIWLFPLLNKLLRSHDFDLLIPFQFFITDLYEQLTHEHQNYVSTFPTNYDPVFHVYRGQAIATEELNLTRETGIGFANASVTGTEDDIKCILYELEIDTRLQNSKPFTAVSHQR